MRPFRFLRILLALGAGAAPSAAGQDSAMISDSCLHYFPHHVRVTGKLVTEPHYGPPGFGESPKEDAKLDIPILLLSHPIAVCGNPRSDADNWNSFQGVTKLQVVGGFKVEAFIGEEVQLIGRLFEAGTANQYTDVLILADSARVPNHPTRRL